MEYTSKLFVDFLKKLIVFDKDSQSAIQVASRVKNDRDAGEKNEWDRVRTTAEQQAKNFYYHRFPEADGQRSFS